MKRFLLSAIALVVAFAANAATAVETTTFQGKIAVGFETIPEIDDNSDAATVVFSKMDDGTYQFVLQQFSFSGLVIGDVTITKGLNAEEKDGTIVLTTDNVEAPVTNSEMAAMLGGKVLITMKATIKEGKMVAELSNIHVNLSGTEMDVTAKFESSSSTGINSVSTASAQTSRIYDLSGRELPAMQKGLNIVKMANGETVKIIK
ncbi:calycin-like domain-containing protein [Prevotella sp.]|uniref:calycin-like domain-containing protein n=1 Tax=Prevotella sp. TaxID=59823 RepID=UPI002E78E4CA|nr:calycin-like domain-containing protein [Prevotella sp.]MEE0670722.1 calycin-like domain-containing protein [Prevotella sp.]